MQQDHMTKPIPALRVDFMPRSILSRLKPFVKILGGYMGILSGQPWQR